jgi:hypothetical protein
MKTKDRFNNVNNNKNIIYINLQNPTVKRKKQNKQPQEQQQSDNQSSDLYPTLYRPIVYDNSSPNMERLADVKNVLGRGAEKSFISMGTPEEVMNVESNIDEIGDKQEEERLAGKRRKMKIGLPVKSEVRKNIFDTPMNKKDDGYAGDNDKETPKKADKKSYIDERNNLKGIYESLGGNDPIILASTRKTSIQNAIKKIQDGEGRKT